MGIFFLRLETYRILIHIIIGGGMHADCQNIGLKISKKNLVEKWKICLLWMCNWCSYGQSHKISQKFSKKKKVNAWMSGPILLHCNFFSNWFCSKPFGGLYYHFESFKKKKKALCTSKIIINQKSFIYLFIYL